MEQQEMTMEGVCTAIFNIPVDGNNAGAFSSYDLDSICTLVGKHPSNVTFLRIVVDITRWDQVQNLLSTLEDPADHLHHLEIHVSYSHRIYPPDVLLVHGRFPSLRRLALVGLFIMPSCDVIPQLQSLKLWNYPPYARVPSGKLLAALKKATSLRDLDIASFLFIVNFQHTAAVQAPLELPNLSTFVCRDKIEPIGLFLREVNLGKYVSADITAGLPSDYATDPNTTYGPVLSVLPHHANGAARPFTECRADEVSDYAPVGWLFPSDRNAPTLLKTLTDFRLYRNQNGEMELTGTNQSTRGGSLVCRIGPRNCPLAKYQLMSSALRALCSDLVIQRGVNLQTLHIAVELDFISPVTWYRFLYATPHLTLLNLIDTGRFGPTSPGAHTVFRALTPNPDVGERDEAELPGLSDIVKRHARSPPCGDFRLPAPRLVTIGLAGSVLSASLLATIRTAMTSRVAHAPKEIGPLRKTLSINLRIVHPGTTIDQVEAIKTELEALKQWASDPSVNTNATIYASPESHLPV